LFIAPFLIIICLYCHVSPPCSCGRICYDCFLEYIESCDKEKEKAKDNDREDLAARCLFCSKPFSRAIAYSQQALALAIMAHDAGCEVVTGRSSLVPLALPVHNVELTENARQVIETRIIAMEKELEKEPGVGLEFLDIVTVQELVADMPAHAVSFLDSYENLEAPAYHD
jgi:hypothetical protein